MTKSTLVVTSRGTSASTKSTASDLIAFITGIKESSQGGTREAADILDMHEAPGLVYFESTKRSVDTPAIWITNLIYTLKCRVLFTFSASELIFDANFSTQRANFVLFDKSFDNGKYLLVKKVLFDVFRGTASSDAAFDPSESEDDDIDNVKKRSEKNIHLDKMQSDVLQKRNDDQSESVEINSKLSQSTCSEKNSKKYSTDKSDISDHFESTVSSHPLNSQYFNSNLELELKRELWNEEEYRLYVKSAKSSGCDRILSFFILNDKIWLRAYVIDGGIHEIGPRVVFEIEKIMKGTLKGDILYKAENHLIFTREGSLQPKVEQKFEKTSDQSINLNKNDDSVSELHLYKEESRKQEVMETVDEKLVAYDPKPHHNTSDILSKDALRSADIDKSEQITSNTTDDSNHTLNINYQSKITNNNPNPETISIDFQKSDEKKVSKDAVHISKTINHDSNMKGSTSVDLNAIKILENVELNRIADKEIQSDCQNVVIAETFHFSPINANNPSLEQFNLTTLEVESHTSKTSSISSEKPSESKTDAYNHSSVSTKAAGDNSFDTKKDFMRGKCDDNRDSTDPTISENIQDFKKKVALKRKSIPASKNKKQKKPTQTQATKVDTEIINKSEDYLDVGGKKEQTNKNILATNATKKVNFITNQESQQKSNEPEVCTIQGEKADQEVIKTFTNQKNPKKAGRQSTKKATTKPTTPRRKK